jgi:hypothetical protein
MRVAERPIPRSGFAAQSTPPLRNRRARWKDGRLLLGVLLVVGSALVGAKVLSAADNTTAVWAAGRDLPAGTTLSSSDLTTVRVRFTSGEAAGQYVAADAELKGLVVTRPISKGEFVPREAASSKAQTEQTELPLSVAAGRLPTDTATGDQVDIWVVPKEGQARLLWDEVRVVQIEGQKGVSGGSARRQVLVGLTTKDVSKLPAALTLMSDGEPVLVRRGR